MSKTSHDKPIDYYLNRRYPFLVHASEDGGYVAEIEELPGCATQADTLKEVEQNIEEARRAWMEVAYEEGLEIPPPRTETEYSGKFIMRVPRTLHRELAEAASRENTSLNQYVLFLLSSGTALRSIQTSVRETLWQQRGTAAQHFILAASRQPATEWVVGTGTIECMNLTVKQRSRSVMGENMREIEQLGEELMKKVAA
jgi:antitoxin HicB